MVAVGDFAPEFSLESDTGERVSLSQYRGRKVVVYFYPAAGTGGCTRQAVAVRDAYQKLQAAGITVIGISPDTLAALAKFRADHDLPFPLLSDPERATIRAYGAWGKRDNGTEGILRSHFIVDEQGRIALAQVKVVPEDTAAVALALAGR
ncbi:MAG: peroxiredoxin [Anaerolineae bacterium]